MSQDRVSNNKDQSSTKEKLSVRLLLANIISALLPPDARRHVIVKVA